MLICPAWPEGRKWSGRGVTEPSAGCGGGWVLPARGGHSWRSTRLNSLPSRISKVGRPGGVRHMDLVPFLTFSLAANHCLVLWCCRLELTGALSLASSCVCTWKPGGWSSRSTISPVEAGIFCESSTTIESNCFSAPWIWYRVQILPSNLVILRPRQVKLSHLGEEMSGAILRYQSARRFRHFDIQSKTVISKTGY